MDKLNPELPRPDWYSRTCYLPAVGHKLQSLAAVAAFASAVVDAFDRKRHEDGRPLQLELGRIELVVVLVDGLGDQHIYSKLVGYVVELADNRLLVAVAAVGDRQQPLEPVELELAGHEFVADAGIELEREHEFRNKRLEVVAR